MFAYRTFLRFWGWSILIGAWTGVFSGWAYGVYYWQHYTFIESMLVFCAATVIGMLYSTVAAITTSLPVAALLGFLVPTQFGRFRLARLAILLFALVIFRFILLSFHMDAEPEFGSTLGVYANMSLTLTTASALFGSWYIIENSGKPKNKKNG